MKKFVFLLALIMIMTAGTAHSQSLHFGIKGGADIKKLSGKSFDDQFTYGYHLGAFAELGITKNIGIQPEIYFSQVNIDTSRHFSDIYNFKKVSGAKLQYINIPILLNLKPNKFVSFQVGPQYGILMNNANTVLQNGKDAFKKGDFSMLAGLQLNIAKVRLYGRYAIGLSNLNDIDNQEKWKSQTVQIGLGFTIL